MATRVVTSWTQRMGGINMLHLSCGFIVATLALMCVWLFFLLVVPRPMTLNYLQASCEAAQFVGILALQSGWMVQTILRSWTCLEIINVLWAWIVLMESPKWTCIIPFTEVLLNQLVAWLSLPNKHMRKPWTVWWPMALFVVIWLFDPSHYLQGLPMKDKMGHFTWLLGWPSRVSQIRKLQARFANKSHKLWWETLWDNETGKGAAQSEWPVKGITNKGTCNSKCHSAFFL